MNTTVVLAIGLVALLVASHADCSQETIGVYTDEVQFQPCTPDTTGVVALYVVCELQQPELSAVQFRISSSSSQIVFSLTAAAGGIDFCSNGDYCIGFVEPLQAVAGVVTVATLLAFPAASGSISLSEALFDGQLAYVDGSGELRNLMQKFGNPESYTFSFGDVPCPLENTDWGDPTPIEATSWSVIKELF